VSRFRDDLGCGDNNDAEWLALLSAVDFAVSADEEDVLFVGDAAVVVAQASGRQPCRSAHLKPHLAAFLAAVASIPRWHVRQVPRSRNLAGIALAQRERLHL
jgi:ribonuclease HI